MSRFYLDIWLDFIEVPSSVVARNARTELACYPRSSFYPMSLTFLLRVIGSLISAFASARLVGLAVKLTCAFTRPARFPSGLSQPYKLLRYFLGMLLQK